MLKDARAVEDARAIEDAGAAGDTRTVEGDVCPDGNSMKRKKNGKRVRGCSEAYEDGVACSVED